MTRKIGPKTLKVCIEEDFAALCAKYDIEIYGLDVMTIYKNSKGNPGEPNFIECETLWDYVSIINKKGINKH